MDKRGKQDKESATTTLEPPEEAEAQAGNPLCPDGEEIVKDNRARRYIRITDAESWRLIDKISQDEVYSKSFNKIINDALFYGLPILYEKLFGEATLSVEEPSIAPPSQRKSRSRLDEEILNVIVRLLRETVLNVTINKSILSSLFHGKYLEYKGCNVDATRFENGLISDTPDYLNDYEIAGLKKLRR